MTFSNQPRAQLGDESNATDSHAVAPRTDATSPITRAAFPRSAFLAITLVAGAIGSAHADPPKSTSKPQVPIARFVPAAANLFVDVRRLGDVDKALARAQAWQVLPLLTGAAPGEEGQPNLQSAIARFLGPDSSIRIDDLMRSEIGIAAEAWTKLEDATWYARIPDADTLDRWFPKDQRKEPRQPGELRFFRTTDGVVVAVKQGIAVMSRRVDRGSMLRDAIALMSGTRKDSLEQAREFQSLLTYLPQRELATVYWRQEKSTPNGPSGSIVDVFSPNLKRAVIRMYEGDGRLDLAMRASLDAPIHRTQLKPATVDQLFRLPQTTIAAAAATIDFTSALATTVNSAAGAGWEKYLVLLDGLAGPEASFRDLLRRLGPNMLVAWEPDLRTAHTAPHVAFLFECDRPAEAAERFETIVTNALKLADSLHEDAATDPQDPIQRTTHLGTTITSLGLSNLFGPRLAQAPWDGVEPAWAVIGRWFVVAIHREQIERILGAQNGLLPTLAVVPDAKTISRDNASWSVLSVAQPGLGADIVERWRSALESGVAPWIDPAWWTAPSDGTRRPANQLGIGMKANQIPGMVVVARVYPGTTAAEQLQPGDRIIGIDGRLLDWTAPNADLRRKWTTSVANNGPTLRVLRGDAALEVVVKKPQESPSTATATPAAMRPADALRELAVLGRALQFASFAVSATDDLHYSARLSMRFAPPAPPGPPATAQANP